MLNDTFSVIFKHCGLVPFEDFGAKIQNDKIWVVFKHYENSFGIEH